MSGSVCMYKQLNTGTYVMKHDYQFDFIIKYNVVGIKLHPLSKLCDMNEKSIKMGS